MPLTLLYRVFYREGSKILCFGSDVTVKNNTIIPLRMALDLSQLPTSTLSSSSLGTTTQQLIELPSLAPGASTSLPIARTRSNCILRGSMASRSLASALRDVASLARYSRCL